MFLEGLFKKITGTSKQTQPDQEFDEAHRVLESFAYNYRFYKDSPDLSNEEVNYREKLNIEEIKNSLSFFMMQEEERRPFVFSEVLQFFIEDERGFFENETGFKQSLYDFQKHGSITITAQDASEHVAT